MKSLRPFSLILTILVFACCVTIAQNPSPTPDPARIMVQAKNVYVITGHVRYYKTKAIVKRELVDSNPFDEPFHKELEKWGRFTTVPDFKHADLYLRIYENGEPKVIPLSGPAVPGNPIFGTSYIILDVVQPSSKRISGTLPKIARAVGAPTPPSPRL